MDVEITKAGGTRTKLSEIGVEVRDFIVSSIEMRPIYSAIEGRSGHVNMGADYGTRSITVPFYFKAADLQDVALARDELFGLVTNAEPFFIREMRRIKEHPGIICDDPTDTRKHKKYDYDNFFVGGKRYKVRLASSFDIDQAFRYGFGELVFETTDLPFAESIGTTADIDRNGINADGGLWGFGMGLQSVDETLRYKHSVDAGQSFRIFNAGNVAVHPFQQDLKITISDVVGSDRAFQMNNLTNGSMFWTNVAVKKSDTIVIDGANVTRNGLSFLRDTGRRFIELSPGWNEFNVLSLLSGSATVEFDFRFYYL